jgi:7,8-dihydropterin-6-yl-methyl-4-(beta-D-ribofuranosyl)aminobenzene 5'-phosphate synthase
MHLLRAPEERLARSIEALRKFAVSRIYPAHCTGQKAVRELLRAFPGRVFPLSVGEVITFP